MNSDAAPGGTPLAGAFICCTSLDRETRDSIHKIAQALGAECSSDLQVTATHLIIGATNSAKYNWVAKERPDIKVVFPDFIDAVREIWLKGEEADVHALEEKYKVPALFGLKICTTAALRDRLTTIIESNGAEYHEQLSKKVTHLIVKKTEGRKYEYALNWKIKTVGEEWLNDSAERGMRLDEALYNPNIAPEERGKDAWTRALPDSFMAQLKRLRDDSEKKTDTRPTKIRRTLSSRQKSDVQAMWSDLKAVATTNKASQPKDAWEENSEEKDTKNAFDAAKVEPAPRAGPSLQATGPETIFSGLTIYTHGFNKDRFAILEKHITSHGGAVVDTANFVMQNSSLDPSTSYLMFPSDRERQAYGYYPSDLNRATKVNEWWIVTCLVNKRLVSPRENRFCGYFHVGKIPGFEKLTICTTGFTGPDLLHLKRTTELLGAKYDEYLTDKASVLICGLKPSVEKLRHAKSHNLPAVSIDWLWSCIDFGFVVGYDSHPFKKPKGDSTSQQDTKASGSWQLDESLINFKRPAVTGARTKDLKFKNIRPQTDEKRTSGKRTVDDILDDHQDQHGLDDGAMSGNSNTVEGENPHPLKEAAPSRLNSPNKSASLSGNESAKKSEAADISEDTKERTIALAAMLESRIATRSQSDLGSEGSFPRKRKMKFLGRGGPASSRHDSLEESVQESFKKQDTNEGSQEMPASQRLEYEDQEMKKKRAKFKAALTEEPGEAPEPVAEPEIKNVGRTRRKRL